MTFVNLFPNSLWKMGTICGIDRRKNWIKFQKNIFTINLLIEM